MHVDTASAGIEVEGPALVTLSFRVFLKEGSDVIHVTFFGCCVCGVRYYTCVWGLDGMLCGMVECWSGLRSGRAAFPL